MARKYPAPRLTKDLFTETGVCEHGAKQCVTDLSAATVGASVGICACCFHPVPLTDAGRSPLLTREEILGLPETFPWVTKVPPSDDAAAMFCGRCNTTGRAATPLVSFYGAASYTAVSADLSYIFADTDLLPTSKIAILWSVDKYYQDWDDDGHDYDEENVQPRWSVKRLAGYFTTSDPSLFYRAGGHPFGGYPYVRVGEKNVYRTRKEALARRNELIDIDAAALEERARALRSKIVGAVR